MSFTGKEPIIAIVGLAMICIVALILFASASLGPTGVATLVGILGAIATMAARALVYPAAKVDAAGPEVAQAIRDANTPKKGLES